MEAKNLWQQQMEQLLLEVEQQITFSKDDLFVVGCSTSEVIGEKIGTAGGLEVAEVLFEPIKAFAERNKIHLAFQGCEHINRALTMERKTQQLYRLPEVSVIPVVRAGGSMSAYAYTQLEEPVVVESVQAKAGIDIGQTMIGMQLQPVAVPIRVSIKKVGEAIITIATTRPKLIGGARAFYG
ncbi:TIGR01440 family protein [Psychrobacillus sp. FSL K6-2684]|uniref:TIGR01440 family protein n=1 Tax=unclassified Psychrobacillus TaxID=2636677 RepID=UPI0011A8746C|nr:TIGR01440 family protein [Psychrobacillus sp. AK 1817]QEY20770.1 TIGR01440 family protein [Psychrobacillus sp. AK 1817]QGM31300.1 TIGR01440 family protein [Bacillus sp. N3536]